MEAKKIDNLMVIIFAILIVPAIILSIHFQIFYLVGLPFIAYGTYCFIVQRAWLFSKYAYAADERYITGKKARKLAIAYIITGIIVILAFYFLISEMIRIDEYLSSTAIMRGSP